ncbi:hypothetical protein AAFC00_001256 [Neodothiora populina]|uniref:SNF5-domain-containing protein n=1 Tax=Neodothiora populina TaxID=2781224 RepID=A0ABR3PNA1_9PEZI
MQSPSINSPAPPFQTNGQAFNLSQPPAGRNASAQPASPAVNNSAFSSPAATASAQQEASSSSDTGDAIRNGKQRAKDVMAASGIDVPSPSPASYGAQMSRKRSRSGTRKSINTPSAVDGPSSPPASHDEIILNRYIQRDSLHAATMNDQADRSRTLLRAKEQEKEWYMHEVGRIRAQNPGAVFGMGYAGYGNGRTDDRAHIEYPMHRRPPAGRRSRPLYLPRKDLAQQAEYLEELVPVRLDIELEKLRLRDTFTWNLNDRLIDPQQFAETLVEDLKLPQDSSPMIARQVHQELMEQLQNYFPHIYPSGVPAEPDLPYGAHKNDDMRIMIKLNITIGHITLVDQFEWDTNNPLNSPEDFARQMALDLSLSGEFATAIAHSIREQSQLYTRSLFLTNHGFDGRPIEDPDIRDNMLPTPLPSIFRPHQAQKDWTPYMYELSEMELEKTELSMLREQRAQKRQLNRRGGPALPDLKERQRTVRSLVVSSVIPGAAETLEASGIFKIRRAASGRGRRPGARLDEGSDSEDLEADESGAESPAPSQLVGGTARTRGMRGAASAATAAMRANYGRSATPDIMAFSESRTSRRTTAGLDTREDTAEPTSLLVKLKISPARFRQWLSKRKFGRAAAPPLSGFPTSFPQASAAQAPKQAPSTPAMQNKSLPASQRNSATPARTLPQAGDSSVPKDIEYDSQGRVDAPRTPMPNDSTPPIPPWLTTALDQLRTRHPRSKFSGLMRFAAIDADNGTAARFDPKTLPQGSSPPPPIDLPDSSRQQRIKFMWVPRIKCFDCPQKLYTAVPEDTAAKFEVHLMNSKHKAAVKERLEGSGK